jgi:hypothetical protein
VCGQALFEDASGETSLYLAQKQWIRAYVNTGDKSATIGFNTYDFIKTDSATIGGRKHFIYRSFLSGISVKAKVSDGLGTIFSGSKFNSGLGLSGIIGIQGIASAESDEKANNYSLFFRGGINYEKFTYIDTLTFSASTKKKLLAFVNLHGNKLWKFNYKKHPSRKHYIILGGSVGLKHGNNFEDLLDGSASVIKSKDSLAIISSTDGKLGNYKGFATCPINIDFGYIPSILGKNVVGFNGYLREKLGAPNTGKTGKNPFNLGYGLFFSKKEAITSVIGGIAWQFNDVFVKNDKLKQSTIFFYVGYTIN